MDKPKRRYTKLLPPRRQPRPLTIIKRAYRKINESAPPPPSKTDVAWLDRAMQSEGEFGEIEVTPEMIQAGVGADADNDDMFCSINERYAAIYRAMFSARPDDVLV